MSYGINEYASNVVEHMACYAVDIVEPSGFAEAIKRPQSTEWIKAAEIEYQALIETKLGNWSTYPNIVERFTLNGFSRQNVMQKEVLISSRLVCCKGFRTKSRS